MRVLTLGAVVLAGVSLAVVVPVLAAPPSPGPAPFVPPPSSREGRLLAIEMTSRKIAFVVGQAKKDRPELMIDVYRSYTDDQLRDPKRGVTLENLLDIVKADAVPKEVRQRAAETIYLPNVISFDPALSMDGRKEKRKRAEFSAKVNKLLLDSDIFVRGQAQHILDALWTGWGNRPGAIKSCDPRDRNSCVEANRAWSVVFKT